ncbi:MAG: hypothetical protein JNK93_12410 [Planctomycetia bacterium]|nr:hypothetical protein [Planctomycetia bacterium]
MFRLALGLLAITAGLALAEEKKDKKDAPKLAGSWVRDADGTEIKFTFKDKTLDVGAKNGDNGMTATCDYTFKDGVVKAKVTKVVEKGEFPAKPNEGFEFSFKITVKEKKATIDDFKSELEGAKAVVEGEYEKKDD